MGTYDAYKVQIVEMAQKMVNKGYLMATGGNISLRIAGEEKLAVAPSNYDYMKMLPEDVCVLDFKLNVIEGKLKPSVESSLHAGVYQARGDVNARRS